MTLMVYSKKETTWASDEKKGKKKNLERKGQEKPKVGLQVSNQSGKAWKPVPSTGKTDFDYQIAEKTVAGSRAWQTRQAISVCRKCSENRKETMAGEGSPSGNLGLGVGG